MAGAARRRGCTDDLARRLALGLPASAEQDHHGRPSFRVGGAIFATLWAPGRLNVMLEPPDVEAAVSGHECCTPVHWGRSLRAVQVDLAAADAELVEELLHRAWLRRRPATRRHPGEPRLAGGPE